MANNIMKIDILCKNEIKLLRYLVELYAISIEFKFNRPKLRKKLTELLTYYVKYGYNKETKDIAAESLSISMENINVMNAELTKLGFLVTDYKNKHNKTLNKDLIALRDYARGVEDNKLFFFAFDFKNNDS